MALFTITTLEQPPGPPDQVGDLTINLDYGVNHTFTAANFTTETDPVYSHEGGHAAGTVRLLTTPAIGVLKLNTVDISTSTDISIGDIGNLTYEQLIPHTGYTDEFEFTVADVSSNEFATGFGTITIINAVDTTNHPPSKIEDGSASGFTDSTSITLTASSLSNGYTDPNNDPIFYVKILTLPNEGTLKLDGTDVTQDQVITISDIKADKLAYSPDASEGPGDYTFTFAVSDENSGGFIT